MNSCDYGILRTRREWFKSNLRGEQEWQIWQIKQRVLLSQKFDNLRLRLLGAP